jgi:hypothetical protein
MLITSKRLTSGAMGRKARFRMVGDFLLVSSLGIEGKIANLFKAAKPE